MTHSQHPTHISGSVQSSTPNLNSYPWAIRCAHNGIVYPQNRSVSPLDSGRQAQGYLDRGLWSLLYLVYRVGISGPLSTGEDVFGAEEEIGAF